MKKLYYTNRNGQILSSNLEIYTGSNIIFTNTTTYQPFFFFMIPGSQEGRKFMISTINEISSESSIRNNIFLHQKCYSGTSIYKYSRLGSNKTFELRQYHLMSFNKITYDVQILYSLVAPTFVIDFIESSNRYVGQFSFPREDNPREYLIYKRRGRRIYTTYNEDWNYVSSDFLEFWVNDIFRTKSKIDHSLRLDANFLNGLITYMQHVGVKTIYKTDEEINALMYKPKVEAYSIEQLNQWKANLSKMTIESFSKSKIT